MSASDQNKTRADSDSVGHSGGSRDVVVHIHLFKNAGTSVERALHEHFADRWASYDSGFPGARITGNELLQYLTDRPTLSAVSSHQLRPPLPASDHFRFLPVVFLRHPIDRIRSAYDFERNQGSVSPSSTVAAQRTFLEWMDWHRGRKSAQVENFQTMALTSLRGGPGAAPLRVRPIADHLGAAKAFLTNIEAVGVVESYTESWERICQWLSLSFPGFDPPEQHANRTAKGSSLHDRLSSVEADLGSDRYQLMLEENAADLELHGWATARLGSYS